MQHSFLTFSVNGLFYPSAYRIVCLDFLFIIFSYILTSSLVASVGLWKNFTLTCVQETWVYHNFCPAEPSRILLDFIKDFSRLHQGEAFLILNIARNRNGIHPARSLLLINPREIQQHVVIVFSLCKMEMELCPYGGCN